MEQGTVAGDLAAALINVAGRGKAQQAAAGMLDGAEIVIQRRRLHREIAGIAHERAVGIVERSGRAQREIVVAALAERAVAVVDTGRLQQQGLRLDMAALRAVLPPLSRAPGALRLTVPLAARSPPRLDMLPLLALSVASPPARVWLPERSRLHCPQDDVAAGQRPAIGRQARQW